MKASAGQALPALGQNPMLAANPELLAKITAALAEGFATAARGACHLEAISYWRGVGIEWPGWQEGEAQAWVEHKRFDSEIGRVNLNRTPH